jgi:UDP-N-acetylmuramoyl-L-alanyl-D-glutamate--2,6-diaminopimelate ligase
MMLAMNVTPLIAPEVRAAVDRLFDLASSDTGQAGRVANFLLAWHNGADWGGFDLADLFGVDRAIAAGAAAVLVSRPEALPPAGYGGPPFALATPEDPALGLICARLCGHPSAALRVYGVTGTKGKTTVTWMLAHMLRALGEVPALMGTLCYRVGEHTEPATNTTPDALILQRFAAFARDRGATALVLEVSSHALAIGRTAGLAFDAAGFTNLGRDHLDFHGDEAAYFEAKARLFGPAMEAARAAGKAPVAALCLDTPAGEAMRARVAPGVPALTVSLSGGGGDFTVSEVGEPSLDGMDARLETPSGEVFTVRMALFGAHHLLDAGLAAALDSLKVRSAP